jgi:hypothetical protein
MVTITRRRHYACDLDALDNYETPDERKPVAGDDPAANLVSSEVIDSDLHAPTLDIDHHVWVEPSSTPGHGHLFIDVPMTWDQYVRLLDVLVEVGIVEQGYRDASVERKATYLRLPHVRKRTLAEVPA